MTENSPNLMLKYALFGLVGCLVGVFISQYMGYNDGGMYTYLTGAAAGAVGGAIGGLMRKNKGKTS